MTDVTLGALRVIPLANLDPDTGRTILTPGRLLARALGDSVLELEAYAEDPDHPSRIRWETLTVRPSVAEPDPTVVAFRLDVTATTDPR